jgi:MtN3 and saliva related transmembrane protein
MLPQLYRTHKTKKVNDLSLTTLLLILFTNTLWIMHGFFIEDFSLLASGIISLVINTSLLLLYLLYRNTQYR